MPIYEYQCTKCGHRLERLQRLSDDPLSDCPECGGALEKLLSAPAFQFKGTGWYVTDYGGKGKGAGGSGGEEGGSSESKPEKGSSKESESSAKKSSGGNGGSSGSSPSD